MQPSSRLSVWGTLRLVRRIDSEAVARRLARAILADLRLYNQEKVRGGQDLSDEIDEGRQLYRERVEARFFDLFEAAIAELLPEAEGAVSSTAAVTRDAMGERRGIPEGFFRQESREREPRQPKSPVALLLALGLLSLGLVAYWLLRT